MQMEQDIVYLRKLAETTGNENSRKLERVANLLYLVQTNPDSPSEQAGRLEEAIGHLRELQGLDAEAHNEVCLMAERFELEKTELIVLSNATGY